MKLNGITCGITAGIFQSWRDIKFIDRRYDQFKISYVRKDYDLSRGPAVFSEHYTECDEADLRFISVKSRNANAAIAVLARGSDDSTIANNDLYVNWEHVHKLSNNNILFKDGTYCPCEDIGTSGIEDQIEVARNKAREENLMEDRREEARLLDDIIKAGSREKSISAKLKIIR